MNHHIGDAAKRPLARPNNGLKSLETMDLLAAGQVTDAGIRALCASGGGLVQRQAEGRADRRPLNAEDAVGQAEVTKARKEIATRVERRLMTTAKEPAVVTG